MPGLHFRDPAQEKQGLVVELVKVARQGVAVSDHCLIWVQMKGGVIKAGRRWPPAGGVARRWLTWLSELGYALTIFDTETFGSGLLLGPFLFGARHTPYANAPQTKA